MPRGVNASAPANQDEGADLQRSAADAVKDDLVESTTNSSTATSEPTVRRQSPRLLRGIAAVEGDTHTATSKDCVSLSETYVDSQSPTISSNSPTPVSSSQATRSGYLTATELSSYKYNECQLFLRLSHDVRITDSKSAAKPSALTAALFKKGNKWEAKLTEWIKQRDELFEWCAKTSNLLATVLSDDRSSFYITNLNLQLSPIKVNGKDISFGLMKPDFVKVTKQVVNVENDAHETKVTFRIIDAKISNRLKATHQVQIGLYSMALEERLQKESQDLKVRVSFEMDNQGEVWLPSTEPVDANSSSQPLYIPDQVFPISAAREYIKQFFAQDLKTAMEGDIEDVPSHLNKRCEGCSFLAGCAERAKKRKTFESLPSLNNVAIESLQSALKGYKHWAHADKNARTKHFGHMDASKVAVSWNVLWQNLESSNEVALDRTSDLCWMRDMLDSRQFMQNLQYHHPQLYHNICQALSIRTKTGMVHSHLQSPVLASALSNTVEWLGNPSHSFPRSEDVAVCISLAADPETDVLYAYNVIAVESGIETAFFAAEQVLDQNLILRGQRLNRLLVSCLGRLVDEIMRRPNGADLRVQFYVGQYSEKEALSSMIVEEACTIIPSDKEYADVVRCASALVDSPNILKSSVTPNIAHTAGSSATSDSRELMMVPKVVCIFQAFTKLFAFPGVGYHTWDSMMQNVLRTHKLSMDNNSTLSSVHDFWKRGETAQVKKWMEHRSVYSLSSRIFALDLLDGMANANRTTLDSILINEATPLRFGPMSWTPDPYLAKLLFMTHHEFTRSLHEIVDARNTAVNPPKLQWDGKDSKNFHHRFTLVSGSLDLADVRLKGARTKYNMYQWILINASAGDKLSTFNDLKYLSSGGFQLILDDSDAWTLGSVLAFADVTEIEGRHVVLNVKCRVGYNFTFKNQSFFLCRRFQDYNTGRVVSGLLDVEKTRMERSLKDPPLFLRLFHDPQSLNIELPIQLASRRREEGGMDIIKNTPNLSFLGSQDKAFSSMVSRPLTIVWGPPGTGKTHTLALAALRLIESSFRRNPGAKFSIVMTAFTNTAIATFIAKVQELRAKRRSLLRVPFSDWLNRLEVVSLCSGGKLEPKESWKQFTIFGSTVWQIQKQLIADRVAYKGIHDVLIMDEASQIPVSHAALALETIDQKDSFGMKKIILSGDPKQFSPILKGEYPNHAGAKSETSFPLFGSILDCVMANCQDSTVILEENFRMVTQLCQYTGRLYPQLGESGFKPQNGTQMHVINSLLSWQSANGRLLSSHSYGSLLNHICGSKSPMVTIETIMQTGNTSSYQAVLEKEAMLVHNLYDIFREACGASSKIYFVTPHRAQRATITARVGRQLELDRNATVDTVERMQGGEADIVICCLGFASHQATFKREIDFVYNVNRLNVAFSRARALCILIAPPEVLQPPLEVVGSTKACREGADHLVAFYKSSSQIRVHL
ncbi:hypothetical protein HDV05_000378 [Chytridiales sp. JEL 0842]|nr:hypothetical protein HDV05_000378 [Chytridiales sp. JEL 0842]